MRKEGGTLVLVCGPSGGGKDSLIQASHGEMESDRQYVFPKRVITRAEHTAPEEHIHTTMDGFQVSEEGNAFMLHWHAHGHGYGIPGHIMENLKEGRHVIVNVSRSVIQDAMALWPHTKVILVTASLDTAFRRLKERGRESEEEIAQRLKRYDVPVPEGIDLTRINNDGDFDTAFSEFKAAVCSL